MDLLPYLAQTAAEPLLRADWSTGHRWAWILHVLGVILWAGGLLFLTRFLGYHARLAGRGAADAVQAEFTRIEKRLHWLVVTPGLALTLAGGLWSLLAYVPQNLKAGWFHAKLTVAIVLLALQVFTIVKINAMARQPLKGFTPVFSIVHGVAGLLLVAALVLIRFTPF